MMKSKGRINFFLAIVVDFDALRIYLVKKAVKEFVPPPVTISTQKLSVKVGSPY
nr:hypothetical protein [Coxiella endosymbiont of Ornithodoros amblus]